MDSPHRREKEEFFAKLEALHDSDDDTYRVDDEHRKICRDFFHPAAHFENNGLVSKSPSRATAQQPLNPPRRTVSAPTSASATSSSEQKVIRGTPLVRPSDTRATVRPSEGGTSFIAETPLPADSDCGRLQPPRRSATTPLPASRAPARSSVAESSPLTMSATMKKRKRGSGSSTKLVPEAQRIFKGLSFYYIPNNDIAPTRKLRIAKAQEYGAEWVRQLENATHVVVDKNLVYKDVESVLATANAPASLVVVNEEYPVACVSFRALLNPLQRQYRISGSPIPAVQPKASTLPVQESSADLLPLKAPQQNPNRWDYVPPRGTPLRSTPLGSQEPTTGKDPNHTGQIIPESQPGLAEQEVSNDVIVPTSQPDRVHSTVNERELPTLSQRGLRREDSSSRDELYSCIEEMQQFKDLPLDDEDDDMQSVRDPNELMHASDEEGSEDERVRKRRSLAKKNGRKDLSFEEKFACNQGGSKDHNAADSNPNTRTIEILRRMGDYYARTNDHWRTLAYRKAVSTLKRQDIKITTEEEAFRLPSIGRRLAMKIEEIANTDRLQRLEYAQDEPMDRVFDLFCKIYGVGTSQANRWIAQGFRTLEDLSEKAKLTANQRLGIEHYDDLNTRIPRAEVMALGDYVDAAARNVDPDVELLIGGSYRRGSDSSGDIDLIVTKKGTTSAGDLVPFLEELLTRLTTQGFLVATLAALSSHRPAKDGLGSKWHGCCVLPRGPDGAGDDAYRPVWRRIDFLLVPESEYGAALIYFTGNDIFNRSIRLLASKKGMRLNQRGLYKEVMRGPGRVKIAEGELVEGRDEKRIFEILGVKWREPSERWC